MKPAASTERRFHFRTAIAGLLLLLSFFSLSAQKLPHPPVRYFIAVNGGGCGGFWLYNRGTSDPALFNNQGFDRTRFAPYLFGEANAGLYLAKAKLRLYLRPFFSLLAEDVMEQMEHTIWAPRGYAIAETAVPFYGFSLGGDVLWANTRRFTARVGATLGTFDLKTIHPEADNFGFRYCFTLRLPLEYTVLRGHTFSLAAQYHNYRILPVVPNFEHEQHNFHFLGFSAGIEFRFSKKYKGPDPKHPQWNEI